MEDKALRSLWCDGFIPEQYLLDAPTPRITGCAWIGIGPRKQERWKFVLSLDGTTGSRDEISWDALLPPDEATGWLMIDPEARWMQLNFR
jgi:hypothetical protein